MGWFDVGNDSVSSLEVGGDLAVKRRITLCYQWSLEVAEGFHLNREGCELTSLIVADSPLFQQHHQGIYSNAKLTHHLFSPVPQSKFEVQYSYSPVSIFVLKGRPMNDAIVCQFTSFKGVVNP